MVEGAEVAGLLRQLQDARTPLERLQRVALAWRTLRGLGSEERAEVARAIGLDGAESLLERLGGRRGGVPPAALLEAVRAAQRAEPGELDALLADAQRPEGRRRLLIQGLDEMEERLAASASVPVEEAADVDEAAGGEEEGAVRGETTLDAPQPGLPSPPAPPPPAVVPTVETGARGVPVPPVAAAVAASPTVVAARRPAAVRSRQAAAVAPAPPADPPATSSVDDDLGLLERERSIAGRLRRLRRLLAAAPPDLERARRLATAFPDGWQRRRAVEAIAARAPAEVAGALLELLASRRDRRWCARSARPNVE